MQYLHQFSEHNLSSPQIIVPYLVQLFQPKSVIDIGCGLGTFLKVFNDSGVEDFLGVEGDWVNKEMLFIEEKFLHLQDLNKPLEVKRKFDLALCLEVAEHLNPEASQTVVKNLTGVSDMVVFSAAIPNQGGQNHINEQSYSFWIERFREEGYLVADIFRPVFWENSAVQWWYKQNMFLFIKQGPLSEKFNCTDAVSTYIHPDLLAAKNAEIKIRDKEINRLMAKNRSVFAKAIDKIQKLIKPK